MSTMSNLKYWVVGGEYESMDFQSVIKGKEVASGPFFSREEALRVWRELSEVNRPCALTKYSIATQG